MLPLSSFVAQAIKNTPQMARATANALSLRKRSPRRGMENAYAKKALQLYIAVTSEVEVSDTARNHVLAAIVSVIVSVPMTKSMYFCGVRLGRIAYGDSERM